MEMKRRLDSLEALAARTKNPGMGNWIVLAALLMVGLGSWSVGNVTPEMTFSDLVTPIKVFSLIGALGSILGGWVLQSPIAQQGGKE